MAKPARRFWMLDEFLTFDDGTDTRYELFDSQIVGMVPASMARWSRVSAARSAIPCERAARSSPRPGSSRPSVPTAGTRPNSRSPAPG